MTKQGNLFYDTRFPKKPFSLIIEKCKPYIFHYIIVFQSGKISKYGLDFHRFIR